MRYINLHLHYITFDWWAVEHAPGCPWITWMKTVRGGLKSHKLCWLKQQCGWEPATLEAAGYPWYRVLLVMQARKDDSDGGFIMLVDEETSEKSVRQRHYVVTPRPSLREYKDANDGLCPYLSLLYAGVRLHIVFFFRSVFEQERWLYSLPTYL